MAISVKVPAQHQRAINAGANAPATRTRRHVFWMDGDGSTVSFPLPAGWQPYAVSVAGLDQRRGPNEAWEATFDGFVWTVVFDYAPGVVSIGIHCESEV